MSGTVSIQVVANSSQVTQTATALPPGAAWVNPPPNGTALSTVWTPPSILSQAWQYALEFKQGHDDATIMVANGVTFGQIPALAQANASLVPIYGANTVAFSNGAGNVAGVALILAGGAAVAPAASSAATYGYVWVSVNAPGVLTAGAAATTPLGWGLINGTAAAIDQGDIAAFPGGFVMGYTSAPTGAIPGPIGGNGTPLTGQIHHPISTRVGRALQNHPTLRGRYQPRDPRFTTQAVDEAAHCGYQTWHRELDTEVIQWLTDHQQATTTQFEAWLRQRYAQPDLQARFPNGL